MSSRSGIISSVIIVILVFSAVGGYIFLTNQYVPSNIAIVVLDPGFGDRSMVDQAYGGLADVEVVVNYNVEVATDAANARDIMESIAAAGQHDLIVAIGHGLAGPVTDAAGNYPNQRFALIGAEPTLSLANVASATFAQNQAAFLAGSLAAFLATNHANSSGIVGILGSVEGDPIVEELIAGFLHGLNHANTTYNLDVSLLPIDYVGSYNDSDTAHLRAYGMFSPITGNASVIFAPVRASIMGVRTAMEQANETYFHDITGREPYVIAAEGDQDYLGNPNIDIAAGPSWIVTSVVPRSDLAVAQLINATLWFEFPGTQSFLYNLSLVNDEDRGVDLSPMQFRDSTWVTDHMLNVTTDYRQAILNGTIVVDNSLP
ncbi:MAG: BMP family ABC transporter substrate-binding protein [Candidatus Thorarchaeota archaeon]